MLRLCSVGNTYRAKQHRKTKNNKVLVNCLYSKVRFNANKRGLSFKLSLERFKSLIKQRCYMCGEWPKNRFKNKFYDDVFIYQGIDRINNNMGYEDNNVMPCCKKCNGIKSNQDLKVVTKHIKKIIRYYKPIKFGPTKALK